MKHLSELLERLNQCKSAYTSAKTSLDNSLEYLVCREELKQARFDWNEACSEYVMQRLEEDAENIREQYNLEEN